MKPMIKAKSDASYKNYGDKSYIRVGLIIRQKKGMSYSHYKKFIINGKSGSYYAELIGIIELLKKLQNLDGENILVIGDNDGLIRNINNEKALDEYRLEWDFLQFLIKNIRSKNTINFKWQPRDNNRECDKLSKQMEDYAVEYTINGESNAFYCQASNDIEAQQKCQKHLEILKGERILNKKQSKNDINKMLKNFRKSGVAYA